MKKLLLFNIILVISFSSKANFAIWGSAVYLHVNGTEGFYNTKKLTPPAAIGNINFSGNLGVFGFNSGTLKLLGAGVNINRDNGISVCKGILYYSVYLKANRPLVPVFSSLDLGIYCNCNGSSFSNCGGGTCAGTTDQKLQSVSNSIDLTTYAMGIYTLEIYYQVNGDNNGTCLEQRFDNAAGLNYTADFIITSPLALNFSSFNGFTTGNSARLKWVIHNDVDIIKYEVQKSVSGLNFLTLNSVPANRSAAVNNYFFTDANPLNGTNYYRIIAHNSNGAINVSKVMRIYFGEVGNTLFIYANPSAQDLTIRFAAVNRGKYQMSVLNNKGQRIVSIPVDHDGNDKTVHIKLPATLPHGIYRLFLIDKFRFYKQSFFVK